MGKWKSWKFGTEARKLPIFRGGDTTLVQECRISDTIQLGCMARRLPSAFVPETLARILQRPEHFLVKKRRSWDIHKISRLHGGEFYPVPETREIRCENCWVHIPSGTVISSGRQVLCETSLAPECLYEGHSEVTWEDAPWIEDDAFLLATVWGGNFAHWLMDSLPRLVRAPEEKLLVGKSVSRFQQESLALLGYQTDRLIVPETSLVRCRKLRVHVAARTSGVPHPACLESIRNRLQSGAEAKPDAQRRRLYISRQKTRRKILNHGDVFPILQEFGFDEVFCEEMDFAEQVRLFSSAEAIFGAHGAGTLNVLFAPRGAVLIEAYNPQVWDHAAHRVASLAGVRHFHLFAENASKDFDVHIDPHLLARTLALALKAEPPDPRLIENIF